MFGSLKEISDKCKSENKKFWQVILEDDMADRNVDEKESMGKMKELWEAMYQAAKNYDPAKITKYSIELATLFHRFYDGCSVKNAETDELRAARYALCCVVKQTLKNALTILKIDCPEKM